MANCDCLFCENLIYGRDYAEAVAYGEGLMHADCAVQFNAEMNGDEPGDEPWDGYTDAEADAATLASAGYGTDEDYGGGYYDDFDAGGYYDE